MPRKAQQGNQEALNEDSNARVGSVILQEIAQQARLTASPLPKIPYDKKRLDSLIKKVSLVPNNQIVVDGYLKNIEDKISDIHNWQEDEYMEDLYEAMQLALVEIRNTANALCNLIAKYDTLSGFANKLKKILEELTAPLAKELEKRLVPKDEKAALELKTKRLYAAQSFIERNQALQDALTQQLERVKTLLEQPGKPTPRCYISYAWPSSDNKEQEYWVQPFLYILCEHLRAAGIEPIMDVRDNKPGDSIFGFMDQYNDGNYIILIGTPSLLEKHKSYKNHAVKIELNIINNRFERDHELHGESRIYPLLISGTIQTSYPEMYDKYRTVKDCRDNGYLSLIEHLTQWLYGERINKDENLETGYISSWAELHNLYQSQQGSGPDAQIAQIEMEISKDYHRKRLQQLKRRPQYRSVEAQQEIPYSAAVAKNEIASRMRDIGINPQTLFDATGRQFQRPLAIPSFIERKVLWNKMTHYFDSPEQQILSLTAQGLGGVGKTSLAAHYCLHPPRPYELRAWLNAESRTQLSLDYIALAKEMGGVEFDEKEPIDKKVQLVLKWLEGQADCLLVYDNVPNAKEIEGLLPQQGRHHILITSRNSVDWPSAQRLDVDVMDEGEAIELIVNMTGHDKDKNIDALKELVKVLGYLPLALVQAGAYIREHSNDIKRYLDIYQEKKYNNQEELLRYISEVSDATKHEPIWITFDINFDALKKDYPLALATLKQASWLAASNIPEDLLFNMMQVEDGTRDKRLCWDDINKHIKRYSLMRVDTERRSLDIHPLLQDIIRNHGIDSEKFDSRNVSSLYIFLLEKISIFFWENFKKATVVENLLQHFIKLTEHAKSNSIKELWGVFYIVGFTYSRLFDNPEVGVKYLEKAKKIGSDIKIDKINLEAELSDAYYRLDKFQDAENSIINALDYIGEAKKEFFNNHIRCLTQKCVVYFYTKREANAKAITKKISKMLKDFKEESREAAWMFYELSNLYMKFKNFEEATHFSKRAIDLFEKLSDEKFRHLAHPKYNLGSAYFETKDYQNAKKYLQEAMGHFKEMRRNHPLIEVINNKLQKIENLEKCLNDMNNYGSFQGLRLATIPAIGLAMLHMYWRSSSNIHLSIPVSIENKDGEVNGQFGKSLLKSKL